MKINYIANARIPTEKAHGIQIAKMCEAFVLAGNKVTLILPKRQNKISEDLFLYYGVSDNFEVVHLPCIDAVRLSWLFGSIAYYVQAITFALSVKMYLVKNKISSLVYTRDVTSTFFLSNKKFKIILESHNLSNHAGFLYKWLLRKACKHVVITMGLKSAFVKLGFKSEDILVSPDAVDLKIFNNSLSKEGARNKLGLPLNKKIVMYVGHLYKWKGVNTMLMSAKKFDNNIQFVFVGGTHNDIDSFKKLSKNIDNVFVLGHKPYKSVPVYLAAADVLVIPNTGESKLSKIYTSPMKLFEYMASGRPIVASNLPAIKEILNEDMAEFFEADNVESLVVAITRVLSLEDMGEKIAKRASLRVNDFTWKRRVEGILKFISG